MALKTINPTTGNIIQTFETIPTNEIIDIIQKTHQQFCFWKNTSFKERQQKMQALANTLEKNKEKIATLITKEMGKPIVASRSEVEKCAWVCRYYADNAERQLTPEIIKTDLSKSYVIYCPTGVIFAIMPWNFPLWQVFRFLAPNLMAGHTCLLKHAEISTGTGLLIEQLVLEAGFPQNTFRTLVIENEQVACVIENPLITGVTLTGSERAGKSVASTAGRALKKVVLELGGSDPYLILEDADLAHAAKECVASRLNNSGQVCIAAKRILVIDKIYDEFKQHVINEIKNYSVGDPFNENNVMGPMAREDLRRNLHEQVEASIKQGAKLNCGGKIPDGPGFYYPPTLLENVTPEMTAFKEELFGPVICLIKVGDENTAIDLANKTPFGLGAAVFTRNIKRGEEIAATELNAGACAVNTFVKSDPRLPFGGTKNSGFGRELSVDGIRSFMNKKTVMVL